MSSKLAAYLGFSYFLGIGPLIFDRLLKHFNDVEKAYNAPEPDLEKILGPKLCIKFVEFREKFDPPKELQKILDKNITVLTREHKGFPPQLLEIHDRPICLYIKGDLNGYDFKNDRYFAIVGTRNPTSYGIHIAKRFSAELARAGFTIVSGMAIGIDSVAHEAAIDAHGRTIAILGCGINVVYPPSNHRLYDEIIKTGGLIISEFPPERMVHPGLFVSRNRLISGLSRGVLVAEGQRDSGSLITARCALDQGKEVFAPPAPITSNQSEAPNSLIKEGATLVTRVEDIFETFSLSYQKVAIDQSLLPSLSESERSILGLLDHEPLNANEIGKKLQIPIVTILPTLSNLELLKMIEKNDAGVYVRTG
ncbi:DNA protecting protein DprA [Candidatus Roizmanbacteria bacterium RIFCSPLOWO2_01_FULL_38_12]|uniref:DNA protecting protein DprA n=1 Tax=Candidatus Roizmanbacteria bacterium RIFCSPLOWO2_01_FULL_38_12 TaxID=1802061 RepID=A0A1F7IVY0_9BACT|nr:MAG: DNA protecting protein DprA [Candidatus Roizmanbacteria bacterium RIFCSPHIGHO2_12_FULL_38_13]OGK47539.1 MAG: DNA protecting protein DprA [Candidatus Roizmanbacteria bacterium RIFCSPLOWO2_01_FULL_38_12]